MSDGRVCYPYYKNNGQWYNKGLRNKRKQYWAKIRLEEQREKERKAEAEEQRKREEENVADPYADYNR